MKNNATVNFEGFILMMVLVIWFFVAPIVANTVDKKEAPTAMQEMSCEMEESIDSFVEDCLYLNGWRAEE